FAQVGQGEDARLVVRGDSLGMPGYAILGTRSALEPVVAALAALEPEKGGARIGADLLEIFRVEAGWPRYGLDVTEDNLVQETGWEERAVSFTKGCYIGQEVVIRIHHRGHANRHLRGLRFRGELPDPGAPLYSADKAVGSVTSVVRSPRLGPIGLGYVRREVEPDAEVRVGDPESGPAAHVVGLPFRP
ncbi:MAG: YgfZ/GcvT domain-containing protein, partial [Gemmatimonadota bacterium]